MYYGVMFTTLKHSHVIVGAVVIMQTRSTVMKKILVILLYMTMK